MNFLRISLEFTGQNLESESMEIVLDAGNFASEREGILDLPIPIQTLNKYANKLNLLEFSSQTPLLLSKKSFAIFLETVLSASVENLLLQ